MTPQTDQQTEYEDDGTDEFHDGSVSLQPVNPPVVRGENGRLFRGSPRVFYAKLRKRLSDVGIDVDKLDYRTTVDDPPPCFSQKETDYKEWLSLAAVEVVPIRYDLPAEPNYCHDCTPEFKSLAIKAGTCTFPNTRFEVRKADGDKETVGVSRSHSVPPEHYVVYQHMTVPVEALHDMIRAYVSGSPQKRVFKRSDLPQECQKKFDRINLPHNIAEVK